MAQKKDNLPVNVDVDLQNGGTITYANEVIAIIAGVAANEIEGIAGMCSSGGIGDIIGRNRNVTRGVRVELGSEEVSVDIYTIVEYGKPIQKVASEVQENVRKAIESMTGLHVVKVDVHVQGVSFEKEKKEAKDNLAAGHTAVLNEGETPVEEAKEEAKEEPEAEEPAAEQESGDQVQETDAQAEETSPEEPAQDAPEAEVLECSLNESACDACERAPESGEAPEKADGQAAEKQEVYAELLIDDEDLKSDTPESIPVLAQEAAPAEAVQAEPKPKRTRKPRTPKE